MQMNKNVLLVTIAGLMAGFSGCTPEAPPADLLARVQQIEDQWAPDKRIRVFDIEYQYLDGKWVIRGETSVPEIRAELTRIVDETIGQDHAVIELVLLPDQELGAETNAVVDVSVGNLRKHPKHSAEMVDQVLLGSRLKLLKKKGYWYLAQTEYEYLGWITSGSIVRMTAQESDKWQAAEKVEITGNYGQIFEQPSEGSPVVSDLVLNCTVAKKSDSGAWVEVLLAGGRSGFVRKQLTRTFQPPANNADIDREQLIIKAKSLAGIPYLWGGNSSKGLDCSGFTGTVFRSFGYQLPRDANMQAIMGKEIIPAEDWQNILPGDLIFFGRENKITHVAIGLGGARFLHSSDYVQMNSLDKNDELFDEYRWKTIRKVKRIIED